MKQANMRFQKLLLWSFILLIGVVLSFFSEKTAFATNLDEKNKNQAEPLSKEEQSESIVKDIADAFLRLKEDSEEKEKDKKEQFLEEDGDLTQLRVPMPKENPMGGYGATVLIIEVHDTIDMGVASFIERSLDNNLDIAAVIFDINTPGGRVDAATRIRDKILSLPDSIFSVAFIKPRAISAGAFISYACDFIFIADGGSIGAATPVTLEGGSASAAGEKYVSYFRTEMSSTARAKGRSGEIAAAMVDADIEIEGITTKGKLLTLDTGGAIKHGVANAKANSIDDVKQYLALPNAQIRKPQMNWAEKLARVLTDPIFSGILMSIGMLGILIELYQPGFGFPGVIGIVSLLIFFAGHMVVKMAGFEEMILFGLGIILMIVEIFIIPGFGIIGISGLIFMLLGLILSLTALPLDISYQTGALFSAVFRVALSVGSALVMMLAALVFLPKRKMVTNAMVLETAISARSAGGFEGKIVSESLSVGTCGIAATYLRPSGIGNFLGHRIDVTSDGDFVDKGSKIKVVSIEGNRVVVREDKEKV